jgi:vesicle-fusing ATPase
VSGR